MSKIIVSACLLGLPCRYDGKSCPNERVLKLAEKHTLIPVCPEQNGGLSTPRPPAEIIDGKVINKIGTDVSEQYLRGAQIALDVAELNQADFVLLKAKSPSCGKGRIYDGSFSGKLIPGNGKTASFFLKRVTSFLTKKKSTFWSLRLLTKTGPTDRLYIVARLSLKPIRDIGKMRGYRLNSVIPSHACLVSGQGFYLPGQQEEMYETDL